MNFHMSRKRVSPVRCASSRETPRYVSLSERVSNTRRIFETGNIWRNGFVFEAVMSGYRSSSHESTP
jgi:hypothetical protein